MVTLVEGHPGLLGFNESIKMLLLRGKFAEAANICAHFGIHKWALAFDKGPKKWPFSADLIDSKQPAFLHRELREIDSLFEQPLMQPDPEILDFILEKGCAMAEKQGLFLDEECLSGLRRIMKWAFVLIQAFNIDQNMEVVGESIQINGNL